MSLVWQSPGHSENHNRTRRGRCPHRPEAKACAYIPALNQCFSAGPSGGNVLVSARTLIRSRLKGCCRKAAPLRIPRPHRQKYSRMFRLAIGGFIGSVQSRETLNKSPAAGQRIFCSQAAVPKTGKTYSIPPFLEPCLETKSLAASSCRFNQSFPR